jgi:carboxyl-terminal processing protease
VQYVSANPLSGSSGEKAGLRKGDIIYGINGKSTKGMNAMNVLDMLSNDEAETLTLEYGRDGTDDTKTVTLARAKINIENPVSYAVKERVDKSRLGYIKLRDFNNEAVPEMKAAIKALDKQNVDAIVLDLRGNTGGGFQFALNIGGMFLDNKDMVTSVSRNDEKNVFKSSFQEGVLTQLPLILWMDQLSASASEVLAGGLHDNCRAILVGSNSFGKGKIQAVFG